MYKNKCLICGIVIPVIGVMIYMAGASVVHKAGRMKVAYTTDCYAEVDTNE